MGFIRKRIPYALFLLLFLTITAVPCLAEAAVGEVLYHQDFSEVSTASIAGIRKGTVSSENMSVAVTQDALGLYSGDDLRGYALLPEIQWTESHTIEFSFRFTEALTTKGYLSFLLTSWGEEPTNVSAAVFRVNGTIDDFNEPSAAIRTKIQDGELIHVEIPVENGMVHSITLTSGKTTCTVQRESLMRIAEGNRGFGIRNASAEITEVYVVSGTGYTAKTGTYAEKCWAEDSCGGNGTYAPPTGDAIALGWAAGLSGTVAVWAKRRKNRMGNR